MHEYKRRNADIIHTYIDRPTEKNREANPYAPVAWAVCNQVDWDEVNEKIALARPLPSTNTKKRKREKRDENGDGDMDIDTDGSAAKEIEEAALITDGVDGLTVVPD